VRRVSKTLAGVLAVSLLSLCLAACGGGDSSSTEAAQASHEAAKEKVEAKVRELKEKHADANKSAQNGEEKSETAKAGQGEAPVDRKKEAAEFVPKHHQDAGGGSKQYVTKGGDNSVQEYGKEADSQEFNAAAVSLHDFLDARAEGNWAAACDYMAKSVVESFEKLAAQAKQIEDKSCAGILEKLTNPAAKAELKKEAEKADVGSLRTEGDRSFVIYTGLEGAVLAIPMTNEGGKWKVASIAGTPLN
jgi:hypothetical protein